MVQITHLVRGVLAHARSRFALGAPEAKQSAVGGVISLHTQGRPVWTPRNYAALTKEGFSENAVGYRSLEKIASAAMNPPEASKPKPQFRRRFIGRRVM